MSAHSAETDVSETFGEYLKQGYDGDAHVSRAAKKDAQLRAKMKIISDNTMKNLIQPSGTMTNYEMRDPVADEKIHEDPPLVTLSNSMPPAAQQSPDGYRSFTSPYFANNEEQNLNSQQADYKSVPGFSSLRPRKLQESLVSFRQMMGGSISVDGDQFRSINKRGISMMTLFLSFVMALTSLVIPWSTILLDKDFEVPGIGMVAEPKLKVTLLTDFTNNSCKISRVFIVLFLCLSYVGMLVALYQFWKSVSKSGLVSALLSAVLLFSCIFIWSFGCHAALSPNLDQPIRLDSGFYVIMFGCFFCSISFTVRLYDYRIGWEGSHAKQNGLEKQPLRSTKSNIDTNSNANTSAPSSFGLGKSV